MLARDFLLLVTMGMAVSVAAAPVAVPEASVALTGPMPRAADVVGFSTPFCCTLSDT